MLQQIARQDVELVNNDEQLFDAHSTFTSFLLIFFFFLFWFFRVEKYSKMVHARKLGRCTCRSRTSLLNFFFFLELTFSTEREKIGKSGSKNVCFLVFHERNYFFTNFILIVPRWIDFF
jgi:hypothetical protein